MPRIGMRIVKSSIAVFLCFAVYLIRGQGMPFYSAIAAVLCMQPYVSGSVKVALNRTVGTLIGGLFGMLVLLFEQACVPREQPVLQYLLVSVCIIPLIYITLLAKKPAASYITCVVFMSITVSHGADVNPYLFAVNRMVDTLIGIFVSLGVNAFRLPVHQNTDMLFVCSLDGMHNVLDNYCKVKLNHLIERGAQIAVLTAKTPAFLLPQLSDVNLRLPAVVMGGVALYDLPSRRYVQVQELEQEWLSQVLSVFAAHERSCFVYAVIHDMLHVYYDDFAHPAEEEHYRTMRLLPHQNYVCGTLPARHNACMVAAIDTEEVVQSLRAGLLRLPCADALCVRAGAVAGQADCARLEIVSAAASRRHAAALLRAQSGARRLCVFGSEREDAALASFAEHSFAAADAPAELREAAKGCMGAADSRALIGVMQKLFYGAL